MIARKGKIVALLCSAGASSFIAPAIVRAQTADASASATRVEGNVSADESGGVQGNRPVSEIVVTATRSEQSLQDVPMSIDVASGTQLRQLNIFDAKDVERLSPGLQLTNTEGRNNRATLRGITSNPDQGTTPSVDVYLNEIPIDAQAAFTAIYDIDQIEVLRGPQGALRGRTAPAGAITIRTRRPDLHAATGYMQSTLTNKHGYNVQSAVSLPIVEDVLAIRVAALVDGSRLNQVYNVNRDQWSRSRTESARLSVLWKPADNLDVFLFYQYLNADNRMNAQIFGPGNAPTAAFGDDTRSGPPADLDRYVAVHEGLRRFRNRSHFLSLTADWDLDFATVSLVGGRLDSILHQQLDLDVGNAVPNYIGTQFIRTAFYVNNVEARIASNNHDGFWNWTVSAFYNKSYGPTDVTQKADQFFAPAPVSMGLILPIQADTHVPTMRRTLALAASSRFAFTDKLSLEVAARYTALKVDQTSIVSVSSPGAPAFGVAPFSSVSPLVNPALAKRSAHPLTGGATLTYEPTNDLTVYAAYGRSYRPDTAGVSVPQNISSDLVVTKPEKSDAFELGLKINMREPRLSLNVAAFYQKFKGYLSSFRNISYDSGARDPETGLFVGPPDGKVDGSQIGFNYNGNAIVKGVEATLVGQFTENWDFSVAASYAKARFDNAKVPCNDYNGDGKPDAIGTPKITGSGNVSYCPTNGRLADIPDFNLTANSEIRVPMGTLTPFVRGLMVFRPGFESELSSFHFRQREQFDLFVGVRGPDNRWELNAFARNVLNQKRITNILQGESIQSTTAGTYRSGYRMINATNPREFGITASFNF